MALIPLKQSIDVTKGGAIDGWGAPIPGEVLTLKARVENSTRVVTTQTGEEAVASLRIILDKTAVISYDDTLTYTDENGVTVERKPLRIETKRMLDGKPAIVEVYV